MPNTEFWSNLKKKLKDVTATAADFAEEQAIIGKLKFDILTYERKINAKQRDIGVRVIELSRKDTKTDPLADSEVVQFIEDIDNLENKIVITRAEIAKIADEFRGKSAKRTEKAAAEKEAATVAAAKAASDEKVAQQAAAEKAAEAKSATPKPASSKPAATKSTAAKKPVAKKPTTAKPTTKAPAPKSGDKE